MLENVAVPMSMFVRHDGRLIWRFLSHELLVFECSMLLMMTISCVGAVDDRRLPESTLWMSQMVQFD